MRKFFNNKGFTLVELLVVLVILGFVITAIFAVFSSTRKYNDAIEVMNDYQNTASDIMYRLRSELVDAAQAEAIDPADIDLTDQEYTYITINPDGGYILQDFEYNADGSFKLDGSGKKIRAADVEVGKLEPVGEYKAIVSFTTEDTGRTNINVAIERLYDVDSLGNKLRPYSLDTDVILRSAVASGTQNAIKFKRIAN